MVCSDCNNDARAGLSSVLDTIKTAVVQLEEYLTNHYHNSEELNKCSSPSQEGKRRKIESPNANAVDCTRNEEMSPFPQTQDSLNMNIAINDTQLSDEVNEDESIAATEKQLTSPCHRTWQARRKQLADTKSARKENWVDKKVPQNTKKLCLTLKKNSQALRQSRLNFDISKPQTESIESSPNLYTSLKRAQQSRSNLSKFEKTQDLNETSVSTVPSKNPVFESDDDELFFEINSPKRDCSELMPQTPILPSCKSNTSSVVMLTPATQDIVFVDDSADEMDSKTTSKISTMDLIADLMKLDEDASLTQLKKYEMKAINKQRQEYQKQQNTKETTKSKNSDDLPSVSRIKHEPLTELQNVGNESTKLPEDIERCMQEDDMMEEEEEEFPQPMKIKDEKKMSLKDRFQIDCEECEKFIKLLGDDLTDEQIRKHLQNCKHQQLRSNTPEGFWNPLMMSFGADDPRNEVLVDKRWTTNKQQQK